MYKNIVTNTVFNPHHVATWQHDDVQVVEAVPMAQKLP